MSTLTIGDRTLGAGRRVFVIAEIGVNHDGSLERALQLVELARHCDADAIKLQLFSADRLMHKSAAFADYQKSRVQDNDPAAMLRRFELSESSVKTIVTEARQAGLQVLATPFSVEDVDQIERLDLPAIKIASPDIVNKPLLDRAMNYHRPLLISTGAATIGEVRRCVRWTASAEVALLHCISHYPVADRDAQLGWIGELAEAFHRPVGYSDHTTGELSGAIAVAAGACIVEKHLTYDRNAEGPDHAASADAEIFEAYVRSVRKVEQMIGEGCKRVLPVEADVRTVSRQSLVTTRAIQRGERITRDLLTTQRPGTGISAAEIDEVLGSVVQCDLAAGAMLTWNLIDPAQSLHPYRTHAA